MKNTDKIMNYLKLNTTDHKNGFTTTWIADKCMINIKNISRYLKELEETRSIKRTIIQNGKIRTVRIRLLKDYEAYKNKMIEEIKNIPKEAKPLFDNTTRIKIDEIQNDIKLKNVQKNQIQNIPEKPDHAKNIKQLSNNNEFLKKLIIRATHRRIINQEESKKALDIIYKS